MRPFAATILLALASLSAAADKPASKAADKGGMPWGTSYSSALKAAEGAGKPILFDFHTGWCPHCTRMDKTTWKDEALIKLATDSFVVAKINADVEKAPVSRYGLTGYPTVIIAEPGGDQVLRLEGYKDAAQISAALKGYLGSATSLREAFAALRKDKKDAEALLVVGGFYSSVGLPQQAADTYGKAVKSATGPTLARAAAAAGSAWLKAGKPDEARKVVAQGLAGAGATPPASLLLVAAKTEQAAGKADAARGYFERVVKEHPGTDEAKEAAAALGTAPASG